MAEKKYTRITLELEDGLLDSLKTQIRAGGQRPLSATQAVEHAIDSFRRDAGAVKLDEPERREIESRTGATMPMRKSKDVLRAFEKLQGGPSCVTIELDPGVETTMRDVAHGLGLGIAEFAKQVLESSFVEGYMYTCELKPLFFSVTEWRKLTELVRCERIPSGAALLTIIRELRPTNGDAPCQSTAITAPAV